MPETENAVSAGQLIDPTVRGIIPQPLTSVVPGSLVIQLRDADLLKNLTESSLNHIRGRLADFTQQVVGEAKAIERTEHVGSGPPEITAAHVDEAWWVSRRRIRRSRRPVLTGVLRIVEGFGTLAVSIGFSNIKQGWGIGVFIGAVLATATAYVIEMQVSRSE